GAAGDLGCNDGRARSAERLIDRLAGRGVVLDWALHALDGFLRAVPGLRRLRLRDIPNGRLRSAPVPVAILSFSHRVPARLVLPVVIAPADNQAPLIPDDLASDRETGAFQAGRLLDATKPPMPDIG